eukprot:3997016-Amphidinium_carterae.1
MGPRCTSAPLPSAHQSPPISPDHPPSLLLGWEECMLQASRTNNHPAFSSSMRCTSPQNSSHTSLDMLLLRLKPLQSAANRSTGHLHGLRETHTTIYKKTRNCNTVHSPQTDKITYRIHRTRSDEAFLMSF